MRQLLQGQSVSISRQSTPTQTDTSYQPPHPLRQVWMMGMYLFRAMTGAYGLSVTGFIILRALIGEETWSVIAFFNSFIHLLILPAVVLLPLVVLMWRKELMLLTIAPFIAFMTWYAPTFLTTASDVPDSPQMTIATFNIAAYRSQLDEFVALITDMDADVVVLQELSENAAATFTRELADMYPHQVLYPHANAVLGQGVLSRFPVIEENAWMPYAYYQQRVLLNVGDQQVALYNVHIAYPFPNNFARRRQDVQELLVRVNEETVPVIVAGDFNFTEHNSEYGMMTEQYVDAYRQAGRGFGWTFAPLGNLCVDDFPFCTAARIDYVFHDAGISALGARVLSHSAGSDHFPLWVRLALP